MPQQVRFTPDPPIRFTPDYEWQGPPLQARPASLRDVLSRWPGEAWESTKQLGHVLTTPTPGVIPEYSPLEEFAIGFTSGPAAARPVARWGARRLYESALKPAPRANTLAEVRNMVDTGLKEGLTVSYGGMKKLQSLKTDLGDEILSKLGTEPSATVNKFDVTSRLKQPFEKLSMQVNPEADLEVVSESGNEFLRNQPNEIPAMTAQRLKQGTYRSLGDRAFGEVKTGAREGQKHLARGLKEELEAQFPGIRDLNQRQGNVINLESELEAAVNRNENRNLLGFGTPLVGGALHLATGSTPAAVGGSLLKEIFGSPAWKSRLAIGLSRLAGPTP